MPLHGPEEAKPPQEGSVSVTCRGTIHPRDPALIFNGEDNHSNSPRVPGSVCIPGNVYIIKLQPKDGIFFAEIRLWELIQ